MSLTGTDHRLTVIKVEAVQTYYRVGEGHVVVASRATLDTGRYGELTILTSPDETPAIGDEYVMRLSRVEKDKDPR